MFKIQSPETWQIQENIGSLQRNACGTSGYIFMCMIAQLQGVKKEHMSPYIESALIVKWYCQLS